MSKPFAIVDNKIEERILTRSLWSVLNGKPLPFKDLNLTRGDLTNMRETIVRLAQLGALEIDRFGDRIFGASGITLVRTPHQLHLWHPEVYARSLHHALSIFNDLKESGTIWTLCSACEKRITIEITRGQVKRVKPRRHRGTCLVRLEAASMDHPVPQFPEPFAGYHRRPV